MKMKKVITYGTFDLFHYGHLRILQRARELGDYLIVAVSTDEFNEIKGKRCTYPYSHRAQIVEAIKYVDKVIPEENWEQKQRDIVENDVDVLVMGNDWHGKFDHLQKYCAVTYLPRTEDISTTDVKHHVKNERSIAVKK
ncbi:MAG: glycerol-3-phosphate cytidylyltransferase [Calditrichaeota bacterium]|nr:MAG: glycerol-3-phosphate cytidylyltransferase [Calditrichota bacterium]